MILALVAASAPVSAIEAERAFAADAQKLGQWTAFRNWSTDDALMFTPQPVKVYDLLKDSKDPPVSVFWWPGRSYVSCDGRTAVNTGPWVREWGKSVGYFTTVWQLQADGSWKWLIDHGDQLATPRAEGGDIKPRQASCDDLPQGSVMATGTHKDARSGYGGSVDETLSWFWEVRRDGARYLRVNLWNGKQFEAVIEDRIAAPPK
jgi:hypothetical protein